MVWDPTTERTDTPRMVRERISNLAPAFQCCFAQPRLSVWMHHTEIEQRSMPLPNHGGVILGQMFLRGDPLAPVAGGKCSGAFTSNIARTHGRNLIEDCWGSYVAFLYSSSHSSTVLRSPMSSVPCFQSRVSGVHVFFSSADDFSSLHLTRLTIDWDLVAAQATNGDYLTSSTGIREITEVQAGDAVSVDSRGSTTSRYWDPREISRRVQVQDFEAASRLLREATQENIDGWASRYPTAVLLLSGGLDSSIVLGCMAQSPSRPAITCATYYSDQLGDERRYARAVATKLGVKLLELERSKDASLEMILSCRRTSRPLLSFSAFDRYARDLALARSHGASAVFDGELGDNVFGGGTGHEVADYLQIHRLNLGAFRVAADYALLEKISGWKALRIGFRERREKNQQAYWSILKYIEAAGYDASANGLISSDALASYRSVASRYIHPWFLESEGVPLGRFAIIYGLFTMTSGFAEIPFAFGAPGDPALISPLSSQPLVELSLQIASFLHIRDGRERAVARHAFSKVLPASVINRVGKGTNSQWLHALVNHHASFLRETLWDGLLVRAGILDRHKLESALSLSISNTTVGVLDVIRMLYIEAWLRRWEPGALRAAPESMRELREDHARNERANPF